ncbi:Anti-sigma regulatory factor (Ser/Thr protein kinase) [Streptomyces melanosporofaciens]|uniref:Anti-sigma regulatory factor (Ser/Thr protein kinase) n=1 Tax=Streptomyces melanosporofaciens TaxID=67327 RepID=A0A1H5AG16_STRMJ|nr:Anti-sigma regulatory factor (Ser/Thr protein kinase) [Streptomyces melanosporofaciens]
MELQALPSRIGQVRRIVSAQLRYWHLDPLIDPAALAVTELLTNVHRHAEPDKQCTVEIVLMLDRLTVSVRDQDPRLPRLRACDPVATHGRGLALVAAVSQSWGMHARDDGSGKVVWFTLAVPRPTATAKSPLTAHGAGRTAPPHRTDASRPAPAPTTPMTGPAPTPGPATAPAPAPLAPAPTPAPVAPAPVAPAPAPAPAPVAAAPASAVRERAPAAARSAASR